jgi:hypothetical protein
MALTNSKMKDVRGTVTFRKGSELWFHKFELSIRYPKMVAYGSLEIRDQNCR